MSISERDQAFNDGVQAAIEYFEQLADGAEQIPPRAGAVFRTAQLMVLNGYMRDLQNLMKAPRP